MRLLILLFIPGCFGISFAQKTKDHTAVVAELAQKINSASFSKVPVRLAIVTFVPVQGNASAVNTYGDYLTESIIGKLSEHPDKLKLYERKRLDAILKENELMLSGLMKPSEALKIGELLPIDALFSGTYTKLRSYIDVTGRLIDVTSGEVMMSYTGRIKLTKNIKSLFPESPAAISATTVVVSADKPGTSVPKETKIDVEANCKLKTDRFNEKLHDLSTSEKVDALVQESMRTPFENTCGKLHYYFINVLSRYKLYPASYKKFLLSTLDTISYPSGDDRAYSILSYLTSDAHVDPDEWKAGLNTVTKVGDYTLSSYLGFLFNKVSQPDTSELQKRASQYFDLLNKNQIGLPRAIDFNRGFFEMMEALSTNHPLRLYVYGKYADKLVTESEIVVSSHIMYLKRMYGDESNASKKTMVINWIADYFNKHVYKKSAEQLYDFAYEFEPDPNPGTNQFKIDRNKEILMKFPARDLSILIELCRDRFSGYATETPYPSQQSDRIDFCVRHGIAIPGVIPTIPEAEVILKANDVDEQLRVMKLLVQMGDQVRPLEKNFISLLNKKSLEYKETLQEIQSMAVEMLGGMKTKDQKAIGHMINSLKNFNAESEISEEALVTIGGAAVNHLVNQLNSATIHDGGFQYKIVVILGKIGKDAKASASSLQQLLEKTSNKDIRYAIEATLQAFTE